MASISKFTSALLSVPNEITVAAANFNLNFSLMKVEAPAEFHGLRDALSHKRRHEAEEGLPHVTARCLGALFESAIPPIPLLTAAYGKRASEISESIEAPQQSAGMFADRAGADGTSIWAAATSGQHAIAMHLLACMLARIWKPAEATSLWVELVERRKQEIFKAYSTTMATGIPSIMAAQQLFTRDQLSAWDASARSWLQTADAAKRLDQTQLMLIINNVRMPVNTNQEPYESILAAWTSAMNAMEKLICGTPQRVQDGAILLAISAWHLYPNMQVLSNRVKDVNPGDALMASSMLTVSSFGASDAREGVYWSLPLSRMRYYSPPVVSERSLASDTSRISMDEFQIVFLGAFVAQWKRICSDEERCSMLIVRLYERYQRVSKRVPPWFKLLADAALRLTEARGHLQDQYRKLLKLGSRRCEGFLHDSEYSPPAMFGLEYFHILVKCLQNPEERIRLLRHAAELRKNKNTSLLLRYKKIHKSSGTSHQYATVLPHERQSHKRTAAHQIKPSAGYQRYAIGHALESTVACDEFCGCKDLTAGVCFCTENNARCTINCHPNPDMCLAPDPPLVHQCQKPCSEASRCVGCLNKQLQIELAGEGEEALLIHPDSLDRIDDLQFRLRKPDEPGMTTYGLWLGHGSIAAVFQDKDIETYDSYSGSVADMPSAVMNEIEKVVLSDSFDPGILNLDTCCKHWLGEGYQQLRDSTRALVFASKIYASMPGSTVSIEVINSRLYNTAWAGSVPYRKKIVAVPPYGMWWHSDDDAIRQSYLGGHLDLTPGTNAYTTSMVESVIQGSQAAGIINRVSQNGFGYMWTDSRDGPQKRQREDANGFGSDFSNYGSHKLRRSFACIAWFDSGEFDIPLDNLRGVMALVNGDSIYVASSLLSDPSAYTSNNPIRRVFGNLGRSELSLLVPPSDPRLAKPDLSSWKLINHALFDGQLQDCFGGTSLHLTFTDSEDTVFMGNRGLRDRQVIMLEALVSIDDRGRSLGDLDILSMFTNPHVRKLYPCSHSDMERSTFNQQDHLIALDCWEEFLDPPGSTAILRASGNWQARLAAAAAAAQLGKRVVVLSEKPCLQCLERVSPSTLDCDIIIA